MPKKPQKQSPFPFMSIPACEIAIRQRTRLISLISKEYYEHFKREFDVLSPHIPKSAGAVLDIGSGLGGIHLFTFKHNPQGIDINLLDRDSIDPVMKYGFRKTTEAYNSFVESRRYLASGGIPDERLFYWNADSEQDLGRLRQQASRFDVIMSLKSWCFHYPADSYLDMVRATLSPTGIIIVDVRKGTPEREKLQAICPRVTKIKEDVQSELLVFSRV